MPSFPAQLALSALVMGGVVAGLYVLGQRPQKADSSHQARVVATQSGPTSSTPAGARALLPASSWLVIDFDGRLTGAFPFSEAEGECARVPPPSRVGVAILGNPPASPGAPQPTPTGESPVLVLASPAVSPEFWGCVRAEVLAAGGRDLPGGPGEDGMESPSGVLVHRAGRLLFASEPSFQAELRALARGDATSAAVAGAHASLAVGVRTQSRGEDAEPPLLATLQLPDDWLSGVGPEATRTPLRHLLAGALRADAAGGAQGTLECAEPGCEELAAFLLRARADVGRALPPPLREATERSWTAALERQKGGSRGLIRLRWTAGGVSFADWVSGVWRVTLGQREGEPH